MAETVSAAQLIAARLFEAGCRHAFGVPGGEVLTLMQALDAAGVARLQTELLRRAPFERVMAEGKTLFELAKSKSVASAISNTARLGQEMADILEAE